MRKFICVVCGLCVCAALGVRAARDGRHQDQKDQSSQSRGAQVQMIYAHHWIPRDLKIDQTTPAEAVRALGQPESDTSGPLDLIEPIGSQKTFRLMAW